MLNSPPVPFAQLGAVNLRTDVFPARVEFSFDPNVLSKARAIVTADTIYVLVDAQGPPGLLYSGRLEDVRSDDRMMIVTTADGDIGISRSNGCGCGSRLKTFRAYRRGVRMAVPAGAR